MKPNYNPYKVLIISCWSVLVCCLILKLFGADWFTAYSENVVFNRICTYVDEHIWLRKVVASIYCTISGTFVILAMLQQKFYTKVQLFIFIPSLLIRSYSAWISNTLNFIISFIVYLLPVIWLKRKWYRALIGIALLNTFQLISLLLKNVGELFLHNTSFIVSMLLQIDTVIMVMLYYLYSIRKEVVKNV
jgi:hypothetical protein